MGEGSATVSELDAAVRHAAHVLPAQGPISVFIHHNTLHAFQAKPFHDAVLHASRALGVRGYLREERFRELLREGRIDEKDLERARARVLAAENEGAEELLVPEATLVALLLRHGIERETADGLAFRESELDATRSFRADVPASARTRILGGRDERAALSALWAECCAIPLTRRIAPVENRLVMPRDVLRREGAGDPAELANHEVVRLSAAYLDEGLAHGAWPERGEGLLASWRRLVLEAPGVLPAWQTGIAVRLREDAKRDARATVARCLDELGITEAERADAIQAVLLQLPGWAGMFHRLETFPEDRHHGAPPASLLEFLAVRLTYDVLAARWLARERLHFQGSLGELRARPSPSAAPVLLEPHEGAWALFQLCQLAGVARDELAKVDARTRARTLARVDELSEHTLLRIFQEAYEDHYYDEILAGLAANRDARRDAEVSDAPPPAQIVCCIDEREESFRRAIEDVDPRLETFGTAGFFGLPIAYRSVDSSHAQALCPVALKPVSAVHEEAREGEAAQLAERARRRSLWGSVEAGVRRASRSLGLGALLVPTLGVPSALPFALNVLAPRTAARLLRAFEGSVLPAPRTRLAAEPRGETEGLRLGFPLEERVTRVASMLRGIGLTSRFARLVVVLGHGSTSRNNPHESAHDCGACGGAHGGPNGRLFAQIANDPDVRAGLPRAGIDLADDVVFVGGQHDTASDSVRLFDLDRVPPSHAAELVALERTLDAARKLSAHERCRRFESASLELTPEQALRHVEARSEDLSQVRPEFGHCTNAVCIVGRRALSRGLFLDRRAFLVSYDPTVDLTGAILERTLAAVGPVGAGINLEYYFSFVDSLRLGSGTKLPHNITGLLGVMDGPSSDLRTGLPSQMTEIHEPVRLLLVCEATPETLAGICARQPEVAELALGAWVRLFSIDPDTGVMHAFENGGFVPFTPPRTKLTTVERSIDWYRGRRGFLPPALVKRPLGASAGRAARSPAQPERPQREQLDA